jgi:hypothetical protein
MNDGQEKIHTGYLLEGLELFIRKVAYTTNDATSLVRWSNFTAVVTSYTTRIKVISVLMHQP